MAGEWEKVRFGELVKITHGWPFKSECFTEERTGRPIIVSIGNFKYTGGFRFESTTVKEYIAEYPKEYELTPGDILLVMTCQTSGGEILGIPGRIPDDGNIYLHNQRMGKVVIKDRKRIDPGFVYYLALWSDFNRELCVSASGTKILHTAPVRIEAFEFDLPPLAEQKAIAAVLGALDDKIELNRRMNATLETMARALFQSWFVDFDPVRAKLDGRQPVGMDQATSALFPEHLEDSPLGHIPKGWEVCSLANKIELLSGGTPKTSVSDFWDGAIPWYSVKDAPSETDVWVIQTEKQVTKLGIENSAAQVLPQGTTIISARGTVGKLALVGTPMAMNQSCYGVSGVKGYSDYFTYFALRQATADLQQRTHGTVFDTITRQTFETLDCIFPPAPLTQAFDRSVEPLLAQIRANLHQSRTLATLRDTLLPKLLSGELRVVDTGNLIQIAN